MKPSAHFDASTTTAEEQRGLFAELVKQLYANALVGMLATTINSLILAVIQRNVTSSTPLIGWIALLALISLFRYRDIRTFWRKSPEASEAARWMRRFIIGLALSGMAWGSSALFLFPTDSFAHQTFLAFVIGGMVAGSAAAFSSIMKAFLAYSVPALSPIVIRFALFGDELHLAMGGMILLFGVMMFFVARRINTVRTTSVKLRFQNSGLVSYLSAAKEKSDKLNEKLLLEVAERERIEKELRDSEGHLRHLSAKLINAHEEERKLVAREIHDSIGSSLAAMKFKLEKLIMEVGETHPKTSGALESFSQVLQETIQETRRIQMALRPSILDDLGISATIGWFLRQFESTYSHIRIAQEINIEESEVPAALKIVIFRVLQEAMNNITKHSKTDRVNVLLRKMDEEIELRIQDYGQGFDPGKAGSRVGTTRGLGLDSMKERTELSGGSFSIESSEGAGTVIRATWPIGQLSP
jgi:signal transduction histidine kinase